MKTLLGGIIIAIGILVAGASGLCTIVVVGSAISGMAHLHDAARGILGILGLALFVGGIPFALGVCLIVGGRSLIARDDADQDE